MEGNRDLREDRAGNPRWVEGAPLRLGKTFCAATRWCDARTWGRGLDFSSRQGGPMT